MNFSQADKRKFFCFGGIFFFFIAILIVGWNIYKISLEKTMPFSYYIWNHATNEKLSYIQVASRPLAFAFYEQQGQEFYFVYDLDGNYYVAYLTSETVSKLNDATKENPIKIEGVVETVPLDIQELGISAWNDVLEEDQQLAVEDFERYFGNIYLNEGKTVKPFNRFVLLFAVFLAFCGIFLFGYGVFSLKKKH